MTLVNRKNEDELGLDLIDFSSLHAFVRLFVCEFLIMSFIYYCVTLHFCCCHVIFCVLFLVYLLHPAVTSLLFCEYCGLLICNSNLFQPSHALLWLPVATRKPYKDFRFPLSFVHDWTLYVLFDCLHLLWLYTFFT